MYHLLGHDTLHDTYLIHYMIHVSSTQTWYNTWYIHNTLHDTCIMYPTYMIHTWYIVKLDDTCWVGWGTHDTTHDTLHDTCIIYMGSSTYMIHRWYMRGTLHDTCIIYKYLILYHVCVTNCIIRWYIFSVRNTLIQVYHVYYVCITTGTWWYIHDTDMILYHPHEMIHVSTDDTMIHDDTRWYCIIFSGFRFSGLDTLLDTLHDTRWYTHKRWYTMIHAWYRDDTVSNRKRPRIG